MRRSLGERLTAIRSTGGSGAPLSDGTRAGNGGRPSPGPGWEQAGSYTFTRRNEVPNPLSMADMPRPLDYCLLFTRELSPPAVSELVFFDLETTGLSGGPGTAVFLAGFGIPKGERLEIHQFFLADYPGEREFFRLIKSFLPPDPYWISFNGKSFDAPLMRSKGGMNGVDFPFQRHGDLLHVSRRLYKGVLPSCSLSSIESGVLGIARVLDIPGSMAPQIYFDYLRDGPDSRMEALAAHHYEDILSLAKLTAHLSRIGREPLNAGNIDPLGLGLVLGPGEGGEAVLAQGFARGNPACGGLLAQIWKARKDYPQAAMVWERLSRDYQDSRAAVELSKYYEHNARDLDRALAWARRARDLQVLGAKSSGDDLAKRLSRIEAKIRKRSS